MIKLIHNYIVDVSQHNYTLMIDTGKQDKNGKPVYTAIGYYNSLSGAIIAAKEHHIRRQFYGDTFTLSEAVQTITRINLEFCELLNEVLKHD